MELAGHGHGGVKIDTDDVFGGGEAKGFGFGGKTQERGVIEERTFEVLVLLGKQISLLLKLPNVFARSGKRGGDSDVADNQDSNNHTKG